MIAVLFIVALSTFAYFANQAAGDGGNVGGGGAMLLLVLLGLPWSFFVLLYQGDYAADWYPIGLGVAALLNVATLWAVTSKRGHGNLG